MLKMDAFVSILASFYPSEKARFLDYVETYNKNTAFTLLTPQHVVSAKPFDPLAYHFISELYNYTYNYTSRTQYVLKNRYTTEILRHYRKKWRRGLFFDTPALAKYETLKNVILDNNFIGTKQKEEYIALFAKSQRIYFAFCRLARLFKMKRAKANPTAMDLCFNPLHTLKSTILIDLYDDAAKTMYTFRISDLINIINTSLSHSPNFFADPQYIKNPYTNIPFTKAQLYSLYFAIRASSHILPPLFHLFFLEKCSISRFVLKNECYIREEAIRNYLKNMTNETKLYYIRQMLIYHYNDIPHIIIHPQFPKEKLVETFSSFLSDYLVALYSLQPEYKIEAYANLKDRLYEFSIKNQNYGRLEIMTKNKKTNNTFLPSSLETNTILTFNFRS